jgi:undecaprenol kinase
MRTPLWLKPFTHAWRGIRIAFQHERSFRIQVACALILWIFLFVLPLSKWEKVFLLAITVCVLVLELLNSTVERLVDIIRPRLDERAGDIKDLMAGAVLLASMFAGIIGAIMLWPHISDLVMRI